jgi:hypothetical protein
MIRTAAALVVIFCAATALPAAANERRDWFDSLRQPGSGKSCCDIADCVRTDADWRNGGWWVEMRGHWVPVPPSAIVRDTASIDGSAYVCAAVWPMGLARPLPAEMAIAILRDGIFCFVPPDMGS